MRITDTFEAKRDFAALVVAGEAVRITRRGDAAARMLAVRQSPFGTEEQIERALAAIRELHARIRPGPVRRALRDERSS